MKCYVYILQSLKDSKYYVGMSKDIYKRLEYHNSGYVSSTKNRRPFKVVYSEEFDTIPLAREREKYLKSYKGSREKLEILENL